VAWGMIGVTSVNKPHQGVRVAEGGLSQTRPVSGIADLIGLGVKGLMSDADEAILNQPYRTHFFVV